jgi:hypothetical protein
MQLRVEKKRNLIWQGLDKRPAACSRKPKADCFRPKAHDCHNLLVNECREIKMKDLSEFNDVLSQEIQLEELSVSEFEFEDGLWNLRRERNHWEILFESEEGEEGIIVEREDFIDGKLKFEIDGFEQELLLEDFDRIDKFVYEKGII